MKEARKDEMKKLILDHLIKEDALGIRVKASTVPKETYRVQKSPLKIKELKPNEKKFSSQVRLREL